MTLANDPGLQAVEEAILVADLPPVEGVLVGYLLLTEWVGSDGDTYLVESAPDEQPYWKTLGYVEAAKASAYARVRLMHDGDEGQ